MKDMYRFPLVIWSMLHHRILTPGPRGVLVIGHDDFTAGGRWLLPASFSSNNGWHHVHEVAEQLKIDNFLLK